MSQKATLISKDEFNNELLLEIFRQAFMDPHRDTDGDLYLIIDGIRIYPSADDRGVMRVYALFGTKPQTTRQQIVELSNRINDGLMFIRACAPAAVPTGLLLDHYIDTNAGVTALEVVDEVRRFRSLVASIPPLDTENILT